MTMKKSRGMVVRELRERGTRWSGWGVVSPRGLFLEATSERSSYVVKLLGERPKGSYLVRVRATLAPATRSLEVRGGRNFSVSEEFKRGVLAAAAVASDYDGCSAHRYRLGDCVACKLNVVRRVKPRLNRRRLEDPGELARDLRGRAGRVLARRGIQPVEQILDEIFGSSRVGRLKR